MATHTDPELEALPKPRRPWRRLTLALLVVTAIFALWVGHRLRDSVIYALQGFAVQEPLELSNLRPESEPWASNRWVRATGELEPNPPSYHRFLDQDTFELARVRGVPELWVELRVPTGYVGYLPPTLFVGRLVRLADVGLRHQGVARLVREVAGGSASSGAWLLVDGESPAGLRWVLGVVVMLFGFAGFSLWALVKILRPHRR